MTRRAIIVVLAGWALVWSGMYVFVYLYRWEWNRAIVSGVVFLAAETALIGWLLHGRIARLESRDVEHRTQRIERHLVESRASRSAAFDWLDPRRQQTGVFLPMLMGAGLVLSALAWLVEWLAKSTAGRTLERDTATRLARLWPPPGGFLDSGHDQLRDLRGPTARR